MQATNTQTTTAQQRDVVYSDPYKCLPIANDKNAGNVQELYLGGQGIQKLARFEKFVSLDTLWLINNELESLEGLEENFRLKHLYVSDNKLKRLHQSALSHCTFLSQLTLNNNLLDDLENIFAELRPCHHLLALDLFGNPVAQEDNYRLRVIGELPSLQVLDRHEVTNEERALAVALLEKLVSLKSFALKTKVVKVPKYSAEELSQRAQILKSAQLKLRAATAKTRKLLEPAFQNFDKRCLGHLPTSVVLEVLDAFCLWELLLDEDEKGVVVDTYCKPLTLEAIAPGSTMRKRLFHYRRFCEDVLDSELRLLPDEKYVMSPCPEISPGTQTLIKFVGDINRRGKLEAEEKYRASMSASSKAHDAGEDMYFAQSLKGKVPKFELQGLDPYLAGELAKAIKASRKKAESPAFASKTDLDDIFKSMLAYGRIPQVGFKAASDFVMNGSEAISWESVFDSLGSAIVSTEAPLIYWRECDPNEGQKFEGRFTQEGLSLLDTLLRANPKDNTLMLYDKTIKTGITATRLAALRKPTPVAKTHLTPQESFDGASARSDWIVIPNLMPESAADAKKASVLKVSLDIVLVHRVAQL